IMFSPAYLLFVFISVAHAANDWSTPCTSGACSYDLPASAGSSSGTVKIWGSTNAISDITPAAGWQIISCSPDSVNQDIRLVCMSGDATTSGCDHLYQGAGAEGKIVRLPESCGKNAFARVAKASDPADQSIPPTIAARLVRRDGQPPKVRGLTLDTNFGAVDASKNGNVNFALQAATVPGADGNITIPAQGSQRRSRLPARGVGDFVGGAIKGLNDFDTDKSTTLKPLDINKNFNLFNKSLDCPPVSASVSADIGAKAHAVVAIGVAASGTFVPPKISDFGITATLTADIDGTLGLVADVSGTLDSGKIKIFEVGIPGLDFPEILTIGPSFQVNAEAKAELDLNMDLTVGLNYHIDKAQFVFPPKKGQATSGSFKLGDTPLKLSASPAVKATGSVEAHLIPSLNLGVSALGGTVKSEVFVALDASATMQLSLEAQAEAAVTVNKASKRLLAPVGASFGGCFEIKAGLNVNAGADASFFGLFDPSTQVTLFNKDFELFKKCFGTPSRKRSLPRLTRIERLSVVGRAGGLACPSKGVGAPVAVTDQTVRAAG
ncbi:hypothetical protein BD779DRAFT_1448538, partial [Infundibulicybe gibba]